MFLKILGMFPKMLLALGLMLPFSQAAVVQAPKAPVINNIVGQDWGGGTSATTYMLSHREQRHSFVTSDGVIHLLINTGATDGNALQLRSSFDNGATWVTAYTFANTSNLSTDDIFLGTPGPTGTPLQVTYDVSAAGATPALMYAVLMYSAGVWTLQTSQTVSTNAKVQYTEPALTVDAGGNLWLSALTLNTVSGNQVIVMHYQAASSTTWANTALVFPNPNASKGSSGIEHASRPVYVPPSIGNFGMLYQSYTCLYWVTVNGSTVSTPMTLTCNLPTSQTTTINTAFSDVTDTSGNQYLGYVINAGTGTEVYTRTYNASLGTWNTGQALTQATFFNSAVYVKTSLITEASSTFAGMFVNNKGVLAFYASPSLASASSTNYLLEDNLTHASATSTQSYTNPRIDAPAYINTIGLATSTMPVWEQYNYDASSTQSLIYWPLPVNL